MKGRTVATALLVCLSIGGAARGGGADRPGVGDGAIVDPKGLDQIRDDSTRARQFAVEAAAFMAGGKPADAAVVLRQAIHLEPRNPQHVYGLARALAVMGERDAAVGELERAAGLGFTRFAAMAREAELESLRELPRFKRLLAMKDAYLRRTARGTLAALRNRFGEKGYLYEIDDEARLVYAVAMDAAGLAALRAELRDQAKALQTALFADEPDAYVTVLVPTKEDYAKLVRFRNVPGIYVEQGNALVARERGHVMTHEFTHALHAADRAAAGGQPPHAPWVNEGLGVLTESATFAGGEFTPRDPARYATLPYAARRRGLVPLERLVAMDQREFIKRPNVTYAAAGYLMLYLWERQLLRQFYETYKKTHDADPTGRAALEQVTGKKLPDLHEDWRVWLAARAATPAR